MSLPCLFGPRFFVTTKSQIYLLKQSPLNLQNGCVIFCCCFFLAEKTEKEVDEELEKFIQSARIQVNHRIRIARQKAAARSSYF
jgi:hypothetical protein